MVAPSLERVWRISWTLKFRETKRATPRKETIATIVALRGIGKLEAQARLDATKKAATKKTVPTKRAMAAKSKKKR